MTILKFKKTIINILLPLIGAFLFLGIMITLSACSRDNSRNNENFYSNYNNIYDSYTQNNNDTSLTKTREVFTLHETPYNIPSGALHGNHNITMIVLFDAEPPIIQIISPSGDYKDMNTVRYRIDSNFIQYFLPNAQVGTWAINYNLLSNADITVLYFDYEEQIFIQDFQAQTMANEQGNKPISFMVSADETRQFSYFIYAVFTAEDNSIESEVLLEVGNGYSNQTHDITVNLQPIQDMGGFMLRLTVQVEHENSAQGYIEYTSWQDFRVNWLTFN